MPILRFLNDNPAVLAGAAILSTLVAQNVRSSQDELAVATLCWPLLSLLFRLLKISGPPPPVGLRPFEYQGASSRSLWIVSASFTSFVCLHAGTGLLHAYPLLTPCLLASQEHIMRDTVVSTKHPLGPWPNIWFSILAACFVTLTLSNGSFQATAISTATVAPLFLFYIALLSRPSGRVRYLPYNGDFEDAVHHLSWRIAVMLILALIGRSIVYGVALDAVASTLARTLAHSLSQGLLQAGSWYMLTKASQLTSWCIAPATETFGLVVAQVASTATNTEGIFCLLASAFALAQVQAILPGSALGRKRLWGFHLLPLVVCLASAWERNYAQSMARSSFLHDVHHPIEVIIESAKADFQSMLSMQSKTFASADMEYRSRYGIEPPPGFEAWYNFAVANKSPLIDDFDTIYDSVSPFWKLSSAQVLKAMDLVHGVAGSETWRCRFASEDATTTCSHPSRGNDRNVQTLFNRLPFVENMTTSDISFLVNHLDEPRVMLPESYSEGFEKTLLSSRKTWDTLTRSCQESDGRLTQSSGLSFITNVSASRDLCQHPEYQSMHGMLVSPMSFPLIEGFASILSTGALSTMGDMVFPSPAYTEQEFLYDDSKAVEWKDKLNRLYWAGSTTGGFSKTDEWHQFHRQRFVSLAQDLEPRRHSYLEESGGIVSSKSLKHFSKRLYEVVLTRINQCSLLAYFAQFAFFKPAPHADAYRAMRSQFVFDTDGNGISGRYYRLLASNSLPLKQTVLREWHDDRLVPWVHYIPVSLGMEELPEMMQWLAWNERGQEKAREVAESGIQWYLKALREVDMTIYIYRLLLELARLQDPKREARRENDLTVQRRDQYPG